MNTELQTIEKDKGGRPKGSKNAITLLKLSLEQATRERNASKIKKILDNIFDAALEGSFDHQKLVWTAVMSKGGYDNAPSVGMIPEIVIRTEGAAPKVKVSHVIDAEVTPKED